MMKAFTVISILVAVVVLAVVAWIAWPKIKGFALGQPKPLEGFKADQKSAIKSMTPKEREMFQNLQNNSYTTSQIDEMIQNGILNSKVVNKFLSALNVA